MSAAIVELDKPEERAAKEAIEKFTYGDIITKEWLMKVFKLESPKFGTKKEFEKAAFNFLAATEAFKNIMLTNHLMALDSVRGVGYLIVQPSQQTEFALRKFKEAFARDIKKANDVLTNINSSLLTNEEVNARDEAQAKLAAVVSFSRNRIAGGG